MKQICSAYKKIKCTNLILQQWNLQREKWKDKQIDTSSAILLNILLLSVKLS